MNVLLVEDSDAIGKWIALVLGSAQHHVVWERSAAQALGIVEQQPFDVVVTESLLPDRSARELVAQLRVVRGDLRAVIIHPPSSAREEAPTGEVHLWRPFAREALLEATLRSATTLAVDRSGEARPTPSSPALRVVPSPVDLSSPHAAGAEGLPPSLPEALAYLFHQGATGLLFVEHESVKRRVTVRGGAPTFVQGDYSSDNFGRFLVKRKVIDEATLEKSHQLMVSRSLPQGEALVALGALSATRLFQQLRTFHRDRMLVMFSWPQPKLRFDAGAAVPRGEPVYEMEPTTLVFEGYQRHGAVDVLYRWLEQHEGHYALRTERFARLYPAVHTAAPRIPIAELTTGRAPIGPLLRELPIDQIFGLRALQALQVLGMVDVVPKAPAAADDIDIDIDTSAIVGEYGLSEPESLGDSTIINIGALDEIFSLYLGLQFRDHYTILGVAPGASAALITQAYLELRHRIEAATKKGGSNSQAVAGKAKEVLAHLELAHRTLVDDDERRHYDEELAKLNAERLTKRAALGAENRFKSGLAALRESRFKAARIEFEAARALRSQDPLLALYAAWAGYCELQEHAKQIGAYRATLLQHAQTLSDAEGYCFVAQVNLDLGFSEVARDLVQHALTLDRANLTAKALAQQIEALTSSKG